ncbi:MAG: NADH-quinone oxidoreductase subunit C [Cyclobacteriaceae bacterium]|nr:NADH-quinone oxidoreductase subunit C [Cyclobacteriaceae bacterium]MCB0498416.1 NADH-quinone oxidoreductase subunit C [Cyclobacteriaceae bacterium]MCB9237014.1 NADH-quinone oxidoreductase subunit C [Flammeovirgaceae bacterium]MCO5271660.1 NADH-quinone oxidoreductase subunit C [Cyclobacteriaceae bacterium]MCW5901276.1 NADH-quinone oxidoreductase subunit C [Cyclobacteriaceae bacterium]
MSNEEIKKFITGQVAEAIFVEGPQFLQVTVPSIKILPLAHELKSNENTAFDFLFCLTAVDWPEHMEVVYHLKSTRHHHQIAVKAKINTRENPEIESVCHIWRTAEMHEREAYDLFGITFLNHPDLRRLLLTDDWEGWPMRKDYDDPINMIEY